VNPAFVRSWNTVHVIFLQVEVSHPSTGILILSLSSFTSQPLSMRATKGSCRKSVRPLRSLALEIHKLLKSRKQPTTENRQRT
jgi:hypothetical protein